MHLRTRYSHSRARMLNRVSTSVEIAHFRRPIADLVDNEQRWKAERFHTVLQMARLLGLFERRDQVSERALVDASATLRCRDGEADREMCFPDARWARENHILLALDEAERVEAVDLLAFDRRLKREVEVGECLRRWQARRAHRGLEPPIIAQRDLRAKLITHFEPPRANRG